MTTFHGKWESSIFLSGPLKGVFWYFKVERRVLTSGTVLNKSQNMAHNFDKNQFVGVKKSKLCHLISSLTTVRAMKTIKRYFHKLLWLTAKKLVYDWEQAENVAENLFLISQFFNDL